MNSNPKFDSPFYPPRARWHNRLFSLSGAIRHRINLDRLRLPKEMTVAGTILGFLIPGIAIYFRGPKLWGQIAIGTCLFLFSFFIVWMGYPAANYAFGVLMSIHATGFIYYCSPFLWNKAFGFRIFFTMAILFLIGFFVYWPLRNGIEAHAITPLRLNEQVFLVQKFSSARTIHSGDWVAYKLSGHLFTNHGYESDYGRNGMGFGPVLAVAGDEIEFSQMGFSVNGVWQTSLPHMPVSGKLVVPQNSWFIWPSFSISGRGDENRIRELMLDASIVSETQFVGKPFKRWFWREQTLHEPI